jgi:hypothetical protein
VRPPAAKAIKLVFAGKIVFLLSQHPVLADKPSLAPADVAAPCPCLLRRALGCSHADSGESSFEHSFRSLRTTDVLPSGVGQHVFSRYR